MKASTFVRKMKTQANIARRLIARNTPAQHMIAVTIEIMKSENLYDPRDVIFNSEDDVYYVRSSFNPGRYFLMGWDEEQKTWECSCDQGCANHKHQTMLRQYLQSTNVA